MENSYLPFCVLAPQYVSHFRFGGWTEQTAEQLEQTEKPRNSLGEQSTVLL